MFLSRMFHRSKEVFRSVSAASAAKVISALEKGCQWQVAVLLLFDMRKVCIEQELFLTRARKVQGTSQTKSLCVAHMY